MVEPTIPRDLAYKDRLTGFLMSNINEEVSRTVADELALGNERQFLVLDVTGLEYTELFSSVRLGSALLYAPNSDGVLWHLWKAATVDRFCDAVRSCVSSGGGGGAGGNPAKPITPGLEGRDMLPANYNCDADHAFGLARAIVEAIHAATLEFFEQIELATNPLELALEISDNIPIVSIASTAGEVLAWVQETIAEIYIAAWSDTTRDDIACDLMCLILEDCTLSYGDVFRLYVEGISGLPSLIDADFLEWMDWLFQITPGTNEATVKTAGLVGLIAMRFGGKFLDLFELGIYSFDMIVKLSADESSDEHGILCDACPEVWESIISVLDSSQGFVVDNGGGSDWNSSWQDQAGWRAGSGEGGTQNDWRKTVSIRLPFTATTLTYVAITYDMDADNRQRARVWTGSQNSGVDETMIDDSQNGLGITTSAGGFEHVTSEIAIFIECSAQSSEQQLGGDCTLKELVLRGTGTKPPELP